MGNNTKDFNKASSLENPEDRAWIEYIRPGSDSIRYYNIFGLRDWDKTIKANSAEANLRAMSAASPELKPVADIILKPENADLKDALDEGFKTRGLKFTTDMKSIFEDTKGGALDPAAFESILKSPEQKAAVVQIIKKLGEKNPKLENGQEIEKADIVKFAKETLALKGQMDKGNLTDPKFQQDVQAWKKSGAAIGVDTEEIINEASQDTMMKTLKGFLTDPAGALRGMGLPPDLIAMLEPLLKFFSSSASYYAFGEGDQPGLVQIGQKMGVDIEAGTKKQEALYEAEGKDVPGRMLEGLNLAGDGKNVAAAELSSPFARAADPNQSAAAVAFTRDTRQAPGPAYAPAN